MIACPKHLLVAIAMFIIVGVASASKKRAPQSSEDERELLVSALVQGNLPEVERLIAAGANVKTMLPNAVLSGNKDIVEFLIAKGADVNAQYEGSASALIFASQYGFTEIARVLIGNGANVDTQGSIRSLVMTADKHLEPSPEDGTALIYASAYGREGVVEALTEPHDSPLKSADVNAKSRNGQTALTYAAQYGWKDIVQILIGKGADPNPRCRSGYTVLMLASKYGWKGVAQSLIEKGADVNAVLLDFPHPAYIKFASGAITYIGPTFTDEEFALLASRNPGATFYPAEGEKKETALTIASDNGQLEIRDLLLKAGANP